MSQAIVERACAKLRSAIGDEAVVRSNFTRDLRDMLKALEAIQPVLNRAEIRSLMDISASQWLELVRAVAYKIIDMIDELQEARSPATTTMTSMLPRLPIMKNAMAIQVQEMKRQVMRIQEQGLTIGSVEGVARNKRATGPVYEEAMVSGRDLDKERTIALLLLSAEGNIKQEPITILPIFGLAGSGKTTLAQMIFNDTHSLQGYDFRVWVHVSPQLDLHTLCESIIHQVTRSGGGQEDGGMDYIMKRLHELLNGRKVLLVLDDLWEQDPIQLQLLKSMLIFMGNKVDIIVTTCNQAIARKICTVEPYKLNPLTLGHEGCEIIRKSIHLLKEEKQEKREKIGWEMPTWCPWEKLGRVLSFDFRTHNSVDSTFSLPLPTLEISYQSMPPDLRLCCTYYCTIFHKGHNIVKDDLVHQWIALHLIEPSEILSATQIADEYITKLLDLSFLQTAKSDPASGKDDKGAILFTMHDLVHDFVNTFLPSYTYYVTNPHMKPDDEYDKYLRALRCVSCSKVEFNDNSFSRKKCLRVLELKESSMQKLPDSICQLRQLGYLKISEFTGLVTLPESFGHLKNLFHIDLSGCSRLAGLPESFGYLINLTHVNLSRCHGLAKLPEQLQKLGKLAHLNLSFWSCFEGIGKGLGGLTTLEHLNLSNPFCHLAQQRSHLQGLKDGLCKLTKLRYLNLSMCLNPIFYIHQSQEDSLQYIRECVKGLSALEHLDLSHNTFLYELPESLGELNRLHTLDLSGCIRIKKVGEMESLKVIIDLSRCRGLESCQLMVRVDEGAYRSTSNLAQLEVVDCKELEISFLERLQCLEEAQRIRLVQKQKVERLKLCWTVGEARGSMKVDENALLGELVPPHSLRCLEICGYGGETCLPAWRIPSISSHLRNLTEVTMEDFPRCVVLPPLGLFPNLQCLVLRRMARITRIDAGELSGGNKEAFTRLSKLTIDDMENLKEFKFAAVDDLVIQKCPLLSFGPLPPRAQRLLISECEQLMSSSVGGIDGVEGPSAPVTELVVQSCNVPLGDWSLLHYLPGICSLTINNCYNLGSSPEIIRAMSSLQSLCFSQCQEPMESLPAFLCDLTSLQELAIGECHGIKSLPEGMVDKLTGLKFLYVWDCPELKKWCESEENKQKLAHILIKFEKFGTSKTGVHPPEM